MKDSITILNPRTFHDSPRFRLIVAVVAIFVGEVAGFLEETAALRKHKLIWNVDTISPKGIGTRRNALASSPAAVLIYQCYLFDSKTLRSCHK